MTHQPQAACVYHPTTAAPYTCCRCGARICYHCARSLPDGNVVCLNCGQAQLAGGQGQFSAGGQAQYATGSMTAFLGGQAPTVAATAVAGGVPCVNHPTNAAVARCIRCRSAVCPTCDFAYPGGLHLCPTCATQPKQVAGERRKLAIWGLGLAITSIVGIGLFVLIAVSAASSGDRSSAAILGFLGIAISWFPAVVGFGLSTGALSSKGGNSVIMWIGSVANGLLAVGWILLMVFGLARG